MKIFESFKEINESKKYAYGEVRSFDEYQKSKTTPDYFLVDIEDEVILRGYTAGNIPTEISKRAKSRGDYRIWSRDTMKNPQPYLDQFPLDYDDKSNWLK